MRDLTELKGHRFGSGSFVVLEMIAQGAFGAVFRCEQPDLQRDVVVKVLRRTDDESEVRFFREARVLSQLDHPYAAHVYAFGVDEVTDLRWIAMELIKGITLADWLKVHGPMPSDRFAPFFERVAEVVHAVHQLGIVHRDLKPANLMVIERAGSLIPKLIDFGIALSDEAGATHRDIPDNDTAPETMRVPFLIEKRRLTRLGCGMGTWPYMAPEQSRGAPDIGPAADLYALAIVAYETLTGRVPFPIPDVLNAENVAKFHDLQNGTVPTLGPGFSKQVTEVFRTALYIYPGGRQRDVLVLAEQLRRALETQPHSQLRALASVWAALGKGDAVQLNSGELLSAGASDTNELVEEDGEIYEECEGTLLETDRSLEHEFLTKNRRRLVRSKWFRRLGVGVVSTVMVCAVTGAVWYRGVLKTERAQQQARAAEQITAITITLAERERGRAALLQGEADAAGHLAKAYQRAPDAETSFMLARALQPLLAEQARFKSSFGRMWSVALSPDEQQLVTTDDKNAQIWDARSYRLRFTLAHGETVYHAVYSADGTRVLTACGDGAVRIWNAHTGALMRELRHEGRALRYRWLSLSPDGAHVAAIDMPGSIVHVWSIDSGAAIAELHNGDGAAAFPSVAFSPDGQWLATSGGKDARVFNAHSWSQVIVIPRVRCMTWAPVGARLLTGNVKGDVSLWEVPGGHRVHHLRDLGEAITAVAYSPDGRTVVAASRDGVEYTWDTASGELRNQANYLREAIRSIEFDRSSTFTVAAALNGSVAVVDAKQGTPVTVLGGPRNVIASAHFDAESRRVIGASWDGTVRIWESEPLYRQWSSAPVADSCGVITALEPDRRIVAVKCDERPTQIWDTIRGQMLAELPSIVSAGDDFSSALPAVSAAGDRAAIARGSSVEVYALPGGKLLFTIAHSAAVNAVAFATNGLDLVTGTVDGSLLVTRDGGSQIVLPKAPAGIDAAGILPDGRVVAADAHRKLRLYDARGAVTATLEVAARVFALRMSSDGSRVITLPKNFANATLPELWDLDHGRLIVRLDGDGQGHVWAARFVGGYVITASSDGAARRWDAATGQLQQQYRGGSRFLADATLSPDGSMVVGGDANGVLRFWDAGSGAPLWTMQAHRAALIGLYLEGDDIVTRGYSGDIFRWRLPKPGRVIEACGHNERCATVLP